MAVLTEFQVQALCDAFRQVDRNKDGLIDPAEIDLMLEETFPGLDVETATAVRNIILREGDKNQDGKIDIGEFLSLIAKRQYDTLMGREEAPAHSGHEPPAQDDREGNGEPQAPEEWDPQVTAIVQELSPEDIDMYRDAFIRLDRNGDGFVGRDELMVSISEYVGQQRFGPLREYLDKIFDVADRDRDNMLSLTEFLASFAHGPGVVPQDVLVHLVASIRVRLTDDEIATLQESFRSIDKNQDGLIDADELFVALKEVLLARSPDLSDQAFRDIVNMVIQSADRDHDGKLNLSEFIRSFQEDQGVLPTAFIDGRSQKAARRLTPEEVAVLKDAFQQLDTNHDGFLDYSEMYSALSELLSKSSLSRDQVRDLVDLIMVTADRNQKGRLTLTEFIANFVKNEELMALPVAAGKERAVAAAKRLQTLLQSGEVDRMIKVFDLLDTKRDGFLDKSELETVLTEIMRERFPEWDADTINGVIEAVISGADTDRDGKLSLQEFVESFARGVGVLPDDVIHAWGAQLKRELSAEEFQIVQKTFVAMDADHDGFVSREELANGLFAALGTILENEAHLQRVTDFVMQKVDADHDGRVSLKEFVLSFERDQGLLPVIQSSQDNSTPTAQKESTPASEDPPSPTRVPRPESPVGKQLLEGSGTEPPKPLPARLGTPLSAVDNGSLPELIKSPTLPVTPVKDSDNRVQPMSQAALLSTPNNRPSVVIVKSPIANDVSGVPITDEQLQVEFARYDTQGLGYLDRVSFKKAYLAMENYGLEPTEQEVDALFSKYDTGSEKLTYQEFCILMLHRSRM